MKEFVLDCSIVMSWCFEDEKDSYADEVLSSLTLEDNAYKAIVPSLFYLEISNVLRVAEKRQRITEAESLYFLDLVSNLPIEGDFFSPSPKDILMISRSYDLSAYNAQYLLIALQKNLPLATLDQKLKEACIKSHIKLAFTQ